MDHEMMLRRIKDQGYRITSRKYLMVSRIDRPDWQEVMAQAHAPWDIEEGREWVGLLGDGAEDHYRRCYSSDTKELGDFPESLVLSIIPNSNWQVTGFIEK